LLALALGLVRDGLVSMERLFELLALNPSHLLGIDSGQLVPGAPADVILFDPGTPWQIDATKFVGQAGNTPFDKIPVQGRVISTIKGGRILG
jgi:dihydroorotase